MTSSGQHGADFPDRFFRGEVTNFRIAASAESSGDRAPELDFLRSDGARQGLRIGIDRHETRAGQAIEHDAIERSRAGTAKADDGQAQVRPRGGGAVTVERNHRCRES